VEEAIELCEKHSEPYSQLLKPENHTKEQQKILGPFYKTNIPLLPTSKRVDMRLFGEPSKLPAYKELATSDYHEIFIGFSGCGKTRALFDVCKEMYTILIECSPTESRKVPESFDRNYVNLALDIKATKEYPEEARVRIEIFGRMLQLYMMLQVDQGLNPEAWLYYQMNGGAVKLVSIITAIKTGFSDVNPDVMMNLHRKLLDAIEKRAYKSKLFNQVQSRLIFAIDEVSVGHHHANGQFTSSKENHAAC
jgi:hypothetical protein